MPAPIYLDNAATTRLHAGAQAAMEPAWRELFANPSAGHAAGARVEKLVDHQRARLASLLGAESKDVIFTSGGSEADSLALFGTALAARKGRVIISSIEHPAVLESANELSNRGFDVHQAPVDETGQVDAERLLDLVDDQTSLVSIIHGNNEIGTLQPIEELARRVKRRNAECRFHTDAVQTFGHLPIRLTGTAIDLLSLSAHKFHGPKGVGALLARNSVRLCPLIYGGSQENGRRAGTLNVPGILGMVAAADFMHDRMAQHRAHLEEFAAVLREGIIKGIPNALFNGHEVDRLPGLVSVSIPGVKSQNLMLFLENAGVLASAGAACKSTSVKQSHVLAAIGRPASYATIRFSASYENTLDEAQEAAARLATVVNRLTH
jgi:cysteine desulfurase